MNFYLGQARPLGLALLCFPVLLWVLETAFAVTEGEVCHSWIYGRDNPDGVFQCPERPDGLDVKFCCGTCSAPYCCASEEARLDQAQCPADLPKTRQPRTSLARDAPLWAVITVVILAIILLVPFGCGLILAIRYAYRHLRSWWESRNPDQHPDQLTIPLPTPSLFDHSSIYDDLPPPYNAVVDPDGPWALSSTSNVPSATQLDHENAGYQDDEAEASPSHPSDPALTRGGPPSSLARASNLVLPPSDAEESHGGRVRTSASQEDPPPSYESVFGLDRDNPPPYSVEDSYAAQARSAAQALAAPLGIPWARSAVRCSPRVRLVHLYDARPRHSTIVSPTIPSDDPPHYSVAVFPGRPILFRPRRFAIASPTIPTYDLPPYRVAVSSGQQILPCHLENPPVVHFRRATPETTEDEVIIESPSALSDSAAACPVLEPALKAEEVD